MSLFMMLQTTRRAARSKQLTRFVNRLEQEKRNVVLTQQYSMVVLTQESVAPRIVGQVRWKHQSKLGKNLEALEERAREKQHEEAVERRQKKKEKKAARKGKKAQGKAAAAEEASSDDDMDDFMEDESDDEEEDLLPDPEVTKARMMQIVDAFVDSLRSIRGAEPTAEFFDDVLVEAYGASNTPLKSVAQVVLVSPTLATATCFDPQLAKPVSIAIRDKLNLNPSVEEGGVVKIPIPRVSMETRKETAALVGKRTEASRQRIRNLRRKVMDTVKQGVAGRLDGVSKDEAFRVQNEIEAITEDMIQKLNAEADRKQDSIMAV